MYGQVEDDSMVSNGDLVSYFASWTQFYFLTLCSRPQMTCDLLDVRTDEGARQRFEQWTVLKLLLFLTIQTFGFVITVLDTFGVALLGMPGASMGSAFAIISFHMAWFGVTKRQGGCGREGYKNPGYFLWVLWLAVEPLLLWYVWPLDMSWGGKFKLLLYAPNLFLAVACIRLFFTPVTPVKTAVERVVDAAHRATTSARAAVQPCCVCSTSTVTTEQEERLF